MDVQQKNALFTTADDLSQKLFFSATDVAPTSENPTKSPLWESYIETRKKLNAHLDEKSRVVAIVITTAYSFVKDEGFKTFYYQHSITAGEEWEKGLRGATVDNRVIYDITRLD